MSVWVREEEGRGEREEGGLSVVVGVSRRGGREGVRRRRGRRVDHDV